MFIIQTQIVKVAKLEKISQKITNFYNELITDMLECDIDNLKVDIQKENNGYNLVMKGLVKAEPANLHLIKK